MDAFLNTLKYAFAPEAVWFKISPSLNDLTIIKFNSMTPARSIFACKLFSRVLVTTA